MSPAVVVPSLREEGQRQSQTGRHEGWVVGYPEVEAGYTTLSQLKKDVIWTGILLQLRDSKTHP